MTPSVTVFLWELRIADPRMNAWLHIHCTTSWRMFSNFFKVLHISAKFFDVAYRGPLNATYMTWLWGKLQRFLFDLILLRKFNFLPCRASGSDCSGFLRGRRIPAIPPAPPPHPFHLPAATMTRTKRQTRPRSLDRSARWSLVNFPNIWNLPKISGSPCPRPPCPRPQCPCPSPPCPCPPCPCPPCSCPPCKW